MKLAVIGAGITGVTTAYFFKKAGHEVTVIDANPYPAMLHLMQMEDNYHLQMQKFGTLGQTYTKVSNGLLKEMLH